MPHTMNDIADGFYEADPDAAPEAFISLLNADAAVWYRAELATVPRKLYRLRTRLLNELANSLPLKKLRTLVGYVNALYAHLEGCAEAPLVPPGDEAVLLLVIPNPHAPEAEDLARQCLL